MTPAAAVPVSDDKAWVVIQTSLPLAGLHEFCRDLERLFRINPLLEFGVWRETAPGRIHAEFRNLSNHRDQVLDLTVVRETDNSFRLEYGQGLKAATHFLLQPTATGSSLTITDDYSRLPASERAGRSGEVDRSLTAWGQALFDFLRRYQRWGWIAPWRWYMQRLWVPMKPSSRRIAWMLCLITAAEFLFFLFVVLIWWIEYR